MNADRARRGLPPWRSWRDEFDDPVAVAGLWVVLMVATGWFIPWPWVLVASIALTVLLVEAIRRTDPNDAGDPGGKEDD